MGLVPREDLEQLALTEPEPVELPFGAGVSAVFEAGRMTDQSTSTTYQLRDEIQNSMRRLGELGGPKGEVPWPLPDSTAEAALGWLDGNKDAIAALRSDPNGPPDPLLKTGEEIRQELKQRVEEARSRASRAGMGAQLVGGAGVAFTDPLNLALLPLGVAGAETLLARMAGEALIGGVSQTLVEGASAGAKERAGVEDTLGDKLGRIGFTGVLAGGLGGVFHGIGRAVELRGKVAAYRKAVADGTVTPNRATEAAADAIQDHLDTVPPQASPAAEAAHLDATVAAVDVLTAGSPEAQAMALRTLSQRTAAWVELSSRLQGERASELLDVTAAARAAGATSTDIARTAAMTAQRVENGVEVTIGGRTILLDDPALLRSKWSVSKIQRAIASRLDDAVAGEAAARAQAEEAQALALRVVGEDGLGRREGEVFRNARQAETARAELGDESLEVVRLGKQQFVLRPTLDPYPTPATIMAAREQRAAFVDAAIAREAEAPRAPVVEPSIDAPAVTVSALPDADRVAFDALTTERPDLPASFVDSDGIAKSGTARELMQQAEEEGTTLRDIMACVLRGGPE